MTKHLIPVGFALAALLTGPALAQTKGEAEPPEKAPALKRATPEEKAAAKPVRKAQGAVAAKDSKIDSAHASAGVAKKTTLAERKAARAARKAAAAEALKKGQITSGEK
jgi:hypothetical protein